MLKQDFFYITLKAKLLVQKESNAVGSHYKIVNYMVHIALRRPRLTDLGKKGISFLSETSFLSINY